MKEAAGEANMTVITIVLIAVVLGIGTVVVTNLMNSNKNSTACQSCGGVWTNGGCYTIGDNGKATDAKVDFSACLNPTNQNGGTQ